MHQKWVQMIPDTISDIFQPINDSPNRACGVGVLTVLLKTPTSSRRGGWPSTLNSKNAYFLKIISPLCDQTGGHDAKRTL